MCATQAESDSQSWHAYLDVTCTYFLSILLPFLSRRALHPLLIQALKISFPTQLAFSPSKCRRLWWFFFFPFHPVDIFSFTPDKDHYWGYWKGVLIIYRRKHIKGPFSRPIRRLLKPLLVATPGLSMLQGAFNLFLCQKFFHYIWRERFHYRRAWPCCFDLFLVKLSTAEVAKRGH